MYRLSLLLVIRYLVCSSCLEDTRLVSQTDSKSVLSCPPWTYHENNDADCLCGDSINGVVLCNRSLSPLYDIWCTSSDDTSPSVCLFNRCKVHTCHPCLALTSIQPFYNLSLPPASRNNSLEIHKQGVGERSEPHSL